jgi:hypothetical protein
VDESRPIIHKKSYKISTIKKGTNRYLNEFKENTNKQLNDIRKTMQDMKEEFGKAIEVALTMPQHLL